MYKSTFILPNFILDKKEGFSSKKDSLRIQKHEARKKELLNQRFFLLQMKRGNIYLKLVKLISEYE